MKKILIIYACLFFTAFLILFGCKDTVTGNSIDSRVMPQSNISFAADLQPVIEIKCATSGCHDGTSVETSLVLTSCSNAKSDPGIIFPGNSGTSRIVWAVEGLNGANPMPPVGVNKPFTAEQIRGLKKWIDEGAKCN
jgi:hypothetical protein